MDSLPANPTAKTSTSEILVEALLRANLASMGPKITRRKSSDPPPLSYAQQSLWLLDQIEPGNPAYNLARAYRISGALDPVILRNCLAEIIRRHEALRTNFRSTNSSLVQVIRPAAHSGDLRDNAALLAEVDWSDCNPSNQDQMLHQYLRNECRRPFDLANDPLLRAILIRLRHNDHILLVVMHHIVSDGWSLNVFFQELKKLYEAHLYEGTFSSLGGLIIQYGDYSVWQRNLLESDALQSQLMYWKQQLKGYPEVLDIPTDRPRPKIQTYEGARHSLFLSKSLSDQLTSFGRKHGATLFMLMNTALNALLLRYSGQKDLIIGSPVANRSQAEINELIGFFANIIPLRTDLSGDPTCLELLGRVREATLGGISNQELPFEKLLHELNPKRSLGYSPIYQVMLVMQIMPPGVAEIADLTLTPLDIDNGTSKYDLTFFISEREGAVQVTIEYSTDLFDVSTIERMIGHFQTLLQCIVDNPDQKISELPTLTEAERHQILVEWNDTKTDYPRDTCIHQLFESQVEQTPDKVAVVYEDQTLTYRQLNARANQLAHNLRRQGVGPDVLVGICVERSLEMIMGLLGILKAGGAYVPLDPTYPKERLAFMTRDTGLRHVLTQKKLAGILPSDIKELTCLDTKTKTLATESEHNLSNRAGAENLAYVMYTSGSTGMPKGVEITHRGVIRLVINTPYARFGADETFLQLASLSFDASTFEIWAPLLHGATCVVCPEIIPSASKLGKIIRNRHISTLWLTASLFNMIVDEDPEALRGLSQLLIGGEKLSTHHVLKAQEHLPGTRVINGYGPTENTTFTCCYTIPQGIDPRMNLAIGRPIANTQVYILDNKRNPVPSCIPGELCIGGHGLARGYLNQPKLTAEKFIPNPFSDEPGARLYKTGDLARYRPDGNIEFLGRMDHQVKIRGFRIELGEIEAVLGQHPAIRTAVAMAREDLPGDKRLVAYAVIRPEVRKPCANELRSFLQQKLPEYMIPSTFVFQDAIPLGPGGKVNRRALPVPDQDRPELGERYVAPRTPAEEALAGIWADVLGVQRIGVHDNFFELGGHSLLATKVISKIRGLMQVDVPLRRLFEAPTVAELADIIDSPFDNLTFCGDVVEALEELENTTDQEAEQAQTDKDNN